MPPLLRLVPVVAPVALLLALGSCAARDASLADDARTAMVGLRADDLRLCAGPPDKRETSEAGEFWTYDRTPSGGGVSVPVPVAGGSVSLSGGGMCRATFQLVEGRVTRTSISGTNELGVARDAACAPVVQGCLRMIRAGTIRTE
ncbi:hypothetical protein GCM10010964_01550 [Caldovatus sediminis]|uniref:Lipoprotein n=1 Tax=Caldovatus sediminis TaxID=2041189 RepID=A0A8J3EAU5_9PROT|nr:hypothetical protein [Caldovatus sediminis]GGG16970.1 hypothetical protein GCM10010964_01550 [Caldovatus sediminis]